MSSWFRIIYDLKQAGLSHEQQAREANVTRKTVENWAAGETRPFYDDAERLLSVYRTVIGSTS